MDRHRLHISSKNFFRTKNLIKVQRINDHWVSSPKWDIYNTTLPSKAQETLKKSGWKDGQSWGSRATAVKQRELSTIWLLVRDAQTTPVNRPTWMIEESFTRLYS